MCVSWAQAAQDEAAPLFSYRFLVLFFTHRVSRGQRPRLRTGHCAVTAWGWLLPRLQWHSTGSWIAYRFISGQLCICKAGDLLCGNPWESQTISLCGSPITIQWQWQFCLIVYIFKFFKHFDKSLAKNWFFFFFFLFIFLLLFHSVPQRIIWQHQQQQIIKRVLKNKMSSRLNNYHTNPISKPLKEKENTSHRRHNRSWQVLKSHSINIQYIFFNDKEREKVFNE